MAVNLYGKEITRYKLDHLGGHENIDTILMNQNIIIYEKGIMISSSIYKGFVYLKWDDIEMIIYCKKIPERVEIVYEEEKTIILEKADKSVNVPDILLKIKSVSPDTEIFEKEEIYNNSEEPEECLFPLDEQDLRVKSLLVDTEDDDMLIVYEKWKNHLIKVLKFPFEAEIFEYLDHGELQQGDNLTVKSIDSIDAYYGILVNVSKKKKQYVFQLCDLEVIDTKSENHLPVNDYSYWFTNDR